MLNRQKETFHRPQEKTFTLMQTHEVPKRGWLKNGEEEGQREEESWMQFI